MYVHSTHFQPSLIFVSQTPNYSILFCPNASKNEKNVYVFNPFQPSLIFVSKVRSFAFTRNNLLTKREVFTTTFLKLLQISNFFCSGWKPTHLTSVFSPWTSVTSPHGTTLTAFADVKYGCLQMLDGLVSTHPIFCNPFSTSGVWLR